MDTKSDDDDSEKKLDIEFRRILRIIKIFIPCISNIEYLASYRMWLEKLSETEQTEKGERNRYLVELCHQIQDGILEPPFIDPPETGRLPFFRRNMEGAIQADASGFLEGFIDSRQVLLENIKNSRSDCTMNFAQLAKDLQNDTPRSTKSPSLQLTIFHKRPPNSGEEQKVVGETAAQYNNQKQQGFVPINESHLQSSHVNLLYYTKPQQTEASFLQKSQLRYPRYQEHSVGEELLKTPTFINAFPQQQNFLHLGLDNEEDDNSWCDMSELSKTTSRLESAYSARSCQPTCPNNSHEKIHETCETKIKDLISIVGELKKHNSALNAKAEVVIHNLADEITLLKNKVQTITEKKIALKNSQLIIASQCNSTVEGLKKKLLCARHENKKLKMKLMELETKSNETSAQKEKDELIVRQRLSNLYNKEIEMLKQNYVKHIIEIENKFTRILNDKESIFNKKISDLSEHYDKKIFDFSREVT